MIIMKEELSSSGSFIRKRELCDVAPRPTKRYRIEKEVVPKFQERKFKKRRLTAVLDELCMRVENNDRQLTNHLLRELDSEHVRSLSGLDVMECSTKLWKACGIAKIDTIAQKIMRTLIAVLSRASSKQYMTFLTKIGDESVCETLFTKFSLDMKVVEIYEYALRKGFIEASKVPQKILKTSRRGLSQVDGCCTQVKTSSIEFFVSYALADKKNVEGLNKVEKLLCDLASDRDLRTRQFAAKGLVKLSEEGVHLNKSTYFHAKELLKDSDSNTRMMSLRLLLYFAIRKPSESIGGKGTIAITDDSFSSICDAINDIDIAVRVEAARILGECDNVSNELLYQTLDKKMMASNKASEVVKVEKSMFSISKKTNQSGTNKRWKFLKTTNQAEQPERSRGGWSRGKELNASCPSSKKEEEEEQEDSIIPHGACGAFVSALEDEFMDVRKAAVYSLGKLAMNRPSFAVTAFEYLADMFNDEIAEVRLDSINALTPLIAHGQINNEQLSVILKCLDDAMSESRQAMRELLKRAQFVDVQCIELCVKSLLACLKRFPNDKDNVFGCLATIGKNHSVYVQSMMRSLLGLNLYFHTREISIEDLNYLGKLIMVLNAASQQQQMIYVLPEFVHRHYRFLRSSSSHLVRPIPILDEQQNGKMKNTVMENLTKAEEIVVNTYQRLCESYNVQSLSDRNMRREDIFRDLSAISSYNENVSGASRLICCLNEITVSIDNVSHTVMCGGDICEIRNLIAQHLGDIHSVEHQFSGFSSEIRNYLSHCRLYLSLLDLAVWVLHSSVPQKDIQAFATSLIKSANLDLLKFGQTSEAFIEFVKNCNGIFRRGTVGEDMKKVITPSTIHTLLSEFVPVLPRKFPAIPSINLKYAHIITPNKDAALESTIKFSSNMPHGIAFEANLFNLLETDLVNVRVKIVFPDGKFDVMKPRDNELRFEGGKHTINTSVKITSSSSWSEAAEIDIVIGLLTSSNSFVVMLASPFCFSQAHVRVKIHPVSR